MELSWRYSRRRDPPVPVMDLTLERFPVEVAVDTGFDGDVLIPFSLFKSLGFLSALSKDEFSLLLPDSRKLGLYTSRCRVKLGDESFESTVHSSPEVEKKVVGRAFLRAFVAALDGGKEELTIRRADG
ncbi:MAG: hypothetical protein KGI38_11245 [Thaumarchaeota archaeon]|nr:hypothetical protein [Nitrososphaerota archaeon]